VEVLERELQSLTGLLREADEAVQLSSQHTELLLQQQQQQQQQHGAGEPGEELTGPVLKEVVKEEELVQRLEREHASQYMELASALERRDGELAQAGVLIKALTVSFSINPEPSTP